MRFSLMIGALGALGANARYWIDKAVSKRFIGPFPWGVFLINVSGSFVLGLLAAAFAGKWNLDKGLQAALTVGFLGAFTTFSTFSLQTVQLIQQAEYLNASLNIFGSVALGLAAAFLGLQLGQTIWVVAGR